MRRLVAWALAGALAGAAGCGAPAGAPPEEARVSGAAGLEGKVGQRVVVRGRAEDTKPSAVVVLDDGAHVVVHGLAGWDGGLRGRRVRVEGRLDRRQTVPAAEQDASGAWSQGGAGDEDWVLDDARWAADEAPGAR